MFAANGDGSNSWDEDEQISKPPEVDKKLGTSDNPRRFFNPEADGIVVKPTCSCRQCTYWTESSDWTTPDFNVCRKTTPKTRTVKPLLRSERHPGRVPRVAAFNTANLTKIEKQAIFRTVVHGEIIPSPVKHLTDTYFTQEIQESLAKLNYKYSLPLQAFAWPAIFRQLSVFMIGEQHSGKTMSYLPAVCTFCLSEDGKCKEFAKYKGPLVVIICPSSKQCEEVYDLSKKILQNFHKQPKITTVTYPIIPVNYTDILITIPDSLIQCLQDRIFNLKRLCHLVVEDGSNLLRSFEANVYKTLEVVDEMLEHRINNYKVQLILTSRKWSVQLEKLYKTLYITPLMCISNYLEAALYGGIKFGIKVLQSQEKRGHLIDILRGKCHIHKTVVFCDQAEVGEIRQFLIQQNIDTIGLSDGASREEVEEQETEWLSARSGRYKVLLCTDFVFETLLNVSDAAWLVHYSFPPTWTRFSKRFSALSSNYHNPWNRKAETQQCRAFLAIDETCERQMPRIINLLKRLGKLPENFKQLAQAQKLKREMEKINDNVNLCDKLKLFGNCPEAFCEYRHLLKEAVDVSEVLPKKGKITFKILRMKDVTQYTVQLLEHVDLDCTVRTMNNDDVKNPLIYSSSAEKIQPKNVRIGEFYSHTADGGVYNLCHVLSEDDSDNVEVKFISGFTLQTSKSNLFEVPSDLKIVDVYICNLIPPFRDERFSGKSFHAARASLRSKNYKNVVLTGDVFLQLNRTLWLHDVVETFTVDGIDVVRFHLTKHLINLKVAEKSTDQIAGLHKLCSKCGITLPSYVKKTAKKPARSAEIEPQVAFLDDNVHEVNLISAISPSEFYVRLTKFHSLLENLEKDIQAEIKNEVLDKNVNVEVGKYYLAVDPQNGESYHRAKVLKAENGKVLCFYVDYGDEAVVDVTTLKTLPSKFISKLPFQAIQCRLCGLNAVADDWAEEATDVLYRYMFEPDSDIFRSLYVEVGAEDDGDFVRAKTKYSVRLKDGHGENNVLINQLLLDCGLAVSIFEKIHDFEIPKPEIVEHSEDSDSDENTSADIVDAGSEEKTFEEFDLEIFNIDEFLEMSGISNIKRLLTPRLTYETSGQNNKIVEDASNEESTGKASYLTPEVYWSQTEKSVKLKIKLIGVSSYKTNLIQRRIFTFSTDLEDKNYQLKFTLYKAAEMRTHRALGQEVEVVLNKIDDLEWMQLTGTNKRLRHIHYEILDLKEEKRRRFLDLGISDEETDDDDQVMLHEISDMDSEFDQEAQSSSSE